jgi:hypothetical protein
MGRTIPSYRLASERERNKWKLFREGLDKKDRKEFDKCFPIQDCIIVRVAMRADLN